MKGLIVTKEHEIRLAEDLPIPEISDYEALVRIDCCMICNGTDNEIRKGTLAEVKIYPVMLGHEAAGRVIKTGKKVISYKKGDLVIRPSQKETVHYNSAWGGFSEYAVVIDYEAVKRDGGDLTAASCGLTQQVVPEGISPVQASLMITLKETCSAIRRIGLTTRDRVLIVGDGAVGLCMLSVCKLMGIHKVWILGNRHCNLERAAAIGARDCYDNHDESAKERLERELTKQLTCYLDTVGTEQTIIQGLRLIQEDGKVAVYGLGTGEQVTIPMKGIRNVSLQFVQWPIQEAEAKTHDYIAQSILDGRLNTDHLITHIFPIEEYEKGFAAVRNKEAVKVALTFHRRKEDW